MPNKAYDSDTENRLLPPDHYRYGKNGRSGTSDKDGVGSAESIRGNTLVAVGAEFEKEIGSCSDTKNNAVIRFIQNAHAPASVTFTTASILTISPGIIIEITGLIAPLAVGSFLRIVQIDVGSIFVGQITDVTDDFYTLLFIDGQTPTLDDIASITLYYYNYIKRYYESTGVDEFLTNPSLMSSVLGWDSTSRIINARVIDSGVSQFLTWTDNVRPCLMNIDRMAEGI